MLGTVDADEDVVEVPCVAGPGTPSSQLIGVGLPEFGAPPGDRLVAEHNTAFEYKFLDVTEAERESKVQPHAVVDDLDRAGGDLCTTVYRCTLDEFSQFAAFNNVTVPWGRRCAHRARR